MNSIVEKILAECDDGLTILSDSIRMPVEQAAAFRRVLVVMSHGHSDVVIVGDNAYATVKCRVEDVPKARLLWAGFRAGLASASSVQSAVETPGGQTADDADRADPKFAEAGMAWWNSMTELDRREALEAAGPNASVAAAYRLYLSASSASSAVPMPGGITADDADRAEREKLARHGTEYGR